MEIEVRIKKNLGDFQLDVSLESDSRRIGILGASGCGKSMTLKSIAGIEEPDQGYIRIGDHVLFDSEKKINLKPQQRNVGYLFQNYALFPNMTVAANIGIGLKCSREEKARRVAEMVEKFQLKGLEDRLPTQLSGGQQQRVALARIMAYEPDVILLDEPFSALDVFLKDHLQQELIAMLEGYKGIVIMVSHSRDEIYNFSDELLVMDGGRDVIYGDTKEIFREPVYVPAARLSGCKNICPVQKVDDYTLHCIDWDIDIHLDRKVEDDISHLGIRAHDFTPFWETPPVNGLAFDLEARAEFPFEMHYYIKSGDGQISYFIQRELLAEFQEKGEPKYIQFQQEALLLLKEKA